MEQKQDILIGRDAGKKHLESIVQSKEAEFARMIGMNPTLLRNYINGFKKPSKEREQEIIEHIHKLGKEMIAA